MLDAEKADEVCMARHCVGSLVVCIPASKSVVWVEWALIGG